MPPGTPIDLTFASGDRTVRRALTVLIGRLATAGLDEDTLGRAEIVLAEVLNNITEHAYALRTPPKGSVRALCTPHPSGVICLVEDHGAPLPPRLVAQLVAGPDPESLPEGGFGWAMIHDLTQNLRYSRRDQVNRLEFLVPVE